MGATRGCTIRLFGVPLFVRFTPVGFNFLILFSIAHFSASLNIFLKWWFQVLTAAFIFHETNVLHLKNKTTGMELYEEVWFQVSRFLRNGSSEKTKRTKGANRAVDA